MASQVAKDLVAEAEFYLVLVATEDGQFDYVWHVKDDEQKKSFQEALRHFLIDNE